MPAKYLSIDGSQHGDALEVSDRRRVFRNGQLSLNAQLASPRGGRQGVAFFKRTNHNKSRKASRDERVSDFNLPFEGHMRSTTSSSEPTSPAQDHLSDDTGSRARCSLSLIAPSAT
eukprot:m.372113 g.372113  ORF g.372113 m.372113 type:complete len:116 (-) comp56143_c0_seq19:3247-3594(-)